MSGAATTTVGTTMDGRGPAGTYAIMVRGSLAIGGAGRQAGITGNGAALICAAHTMSAGGVNSAAAEPALAPVGVPLGWGEAEAVAAGLGVAAVAVVPAGQGVVEVAAATVGASSNIASRSVVTIERGDPPFRRGHHTSESGLGLP
jgi:hypothetical protein